MANGVKEALRGFRGARFWEVASNTKDEYTTGKMIEIEGAQNLTRSPNYQEVRVDADDTVYWQENELQYVDYEFQVAELPLELEAFLSGSEYDEATNKITYNVDDMAPYVAFGYAAPKLDRNFRMWKHYVTKLMGVTCDLTTRGQSGDILPYTISLRSEARKADNNWGTVEDSKDGTIAALGEIDQVQITGNGEG